MLAPAELTSVSATRSTFSIETNHKLPDELVSAIRAFLLSDEDFAKAQKKESPPKPRLDAESAAWARKIVEQRLGEYKTTVEVSRCESGLSASDLSLSAPLFLGTFR